MVGFADETVVGGGESVGARLRQAREAHGFSLDDISARTRVPTRHLKAIEEDAFDQLPAAPYSVGFAKAFADAVGLNREEIGREFRAEKEGYGTVDAGPSYVSEEAGTAANGGLVRIVLIVVIIAAAAFGLWKSGIFGGSSEVATPVVAPLPVPAATPPANTSAPETSTTSSQENASQAGNESASQTNASDEHDKGDKGDKRNKSESSDENGAAAASDKGATSTTGSSESHESEKPAVPTTRDLNLNAQKGASPVAPPAGMTPPVAAPPVIAPPPPAATPAPAATP